MRIEDIQIASVGGPTRLSANVIWEDCDRAPKSIHYQVEEPYGAYLSASPHAFLVPCTIVAMRHGEKRVRVEERICPELRNGLMTAVGWLCSWYGPPRRAVRIEAAAGARAPRERDQERAACLLSGGVDSLTSLRTNRLDFPRDHPRSIRDCLVIHGFDVGGSDRSGQQMAHFCLAERSLGRVAEDADCCLIPVHTNVRQLDDDDAFTLYEFQGAILSSVAHALSSRITALYVASSGDYRFCGPFGSHPLLDPNYGSVELRILHDGFRFSRLDKLCLLADWDVALRNLRVCTSAPPTQLNCGSCEKCVRTMLELMAIGKLDAASSFPAQRVEPEQVEALSLRPDEIPYYEEAIEPLASRGHTHLSEAVRALTVASLKRLAWEEERDWKGAVKRFDRRFLGSSMFRTYRALRSQRERTPRP
ncbi:MAG: hypothetical protein ACOX2R_10820 [Anaerolineae bacterium]|jgi:hypothetical protein